MHLPGQPILRLLRLCNATAGEGGLPSLQAIIAASVLVTLVAFGVNVQPLLAVGSISTGARRALGLAARSGRQQG
jgi:hypothetical protein